MSLSLSLFFLCQFALPSLFVLSVIVIIVFDCFTDYRAEHAYYFYSVCDDNKLSNPTTTATTTTTTTIATVCGNLKPKPSTNDIKWRQRQQLQAKHARFQNHQHYHQHYGSYAAATLDSTHWYVPRLLLHLLYSCRGLLLSFIRQRRKSQKEREREGRPRQNREGAVRHGTRNQITCQTMAAKMAQSTANGHSVVWCCEER